ncbi:MAG: transglycosylase family protein [Acidimicrobiia bacterium]|nr:transglycosylase family protein [Acidimicrobiia bacterium]
MGSYGYSGGLMFLPSTWRNYGGTQYAPQAYQASRSAQIAVAERILADHGGSYQQGWPGCSAELGLP